jgi:hypothetical protein
VAAPAILRPHSPGRTLGVMAEPIIYREEVTAILIVLGDININLARIVRLLEDDDEEEDFEDDP